MRPNLVIIGAAKCGTSSLHRYLARHPEVFMSEPKELRFFTKNWRKGVLWYESHFPVAAAIRGEASPQYSVYPQNPGVPGRMHAVVPDARLIYLIRDPIDRVVSHYLERLGQFREHRELETILENLESSAHAWREYINPSKYWLQLQQYLEFYTRDRILVLTLEDLRARRHETLSRVFGFLEVDDYRDDMFEKHWNESSGKRRKSWFGRLVYPDLVRRALHNDRVPYPVLQGVQAIVYATGKRIERPRLSADLERRLVVSFREDVAALRDFMGTSLPDWRSY